MRTLEQQFAAARRQIEDGRAREAALQATIDSCSGPSHAAAAATEELLQEKVRQLEEAVRIQEGRAEEAIMNANKAAERMHFWRNKAAKETNDLLRLDDRLKVVEPQAARLEEVETSNRSLSARISELERQLYHDTTHRSYSSASCSAK